MYKTLRAFVVCTIIFSSNIFAGVVNFYLEMEQENVSQDLVINLKDEIYKQQYHRYFKKKLKEKWYTEYKLEESPLYKIKIVGKFIDNAVATLKIGSSNSIKVDLKNYIVAKFENESFFSVVIDNPNLEVGTKWSLEFNGKVAVQRLVAFVEKERHEEFVEYENPYQNMLGSFQIDERHFRHLRTTRGALPACKQVKKDDVRCQTTDKYFCTKCYYENRTDHVSYEVWSINNHYKELVQTSGYVKEFSGFGYSFKPKKTRKKELKKCGKRREEAAICGDSQFECTDCMYIKVVPENKLYADSSEYKFFFHVFSK